MHLVNHQHKSRVIAGRWRRGGDRTSRSDTQERQSGVFLRQGATHTHFPGGSVDAPPSRVSTRHETHLIEFRCVSLQPEATPRGVSLKPFDTRNICLMLLFHVIEVYISFDFEARRPYQER